MSENKKVVEIHGCLVCARIFTILAIYTPAGRLVDCTVTSPGGGQIVSNLRQPLVACEAHTTEEIKIAYQRWQARNSKELVDEQDDE